MERGKSMNKPDDKIVGEGITFDDVLLLPRYSEVTPDMVSLKTKLTKHLTLNIPFLSAAMDTVTESDMAIALAREGGIGIIHKNMSIERQAEEVDKVKRSENGVIKDPITLTKDKKLIDAINLMARYHISGIPIVDDGPALSRHHHQPGSQFRDRHDQDHR
jgi:IMP dehydrogenase